MCLTNTEEMTGPQKEPGEELMSNYLQTSEDWGNLTTDIRLPSVLIKKAGDHTTPWVNHNTGEHDTMDKAPQEALT